METINYLAFKKLGDLILISLVPIILGGCFFSNSKTTSAIWYDEVLITTGVDEDRNPIDTITEIEYGIDELICFMSIHGSNTFKLPVAWYHEDKMLYSDVIQFGEAQKGQAHLLKNEERDPLPSGTYRCEWGPVGSPVHVLELEIIQPASS